MSFTVSTDEYYNIIRNEFIEAYEAGDYNGGFHDLIFYVNAQTAAKLMDSQSLASSILKKVPDCCFFLLIDLNNTIMGVKFLEDSSLAYGIVRIGKENK